ncbi:Deoxyribose-phosphate aldolase [Halotydeus destructor]|nr:Deoxyribose-phosphate aldolase [Halotydeus destructor]
MKVADVLNYDEDLFKNVNISTHSVKESAGKISLSALNEDAKIKQLLLAVNCIDLTTLAGDDTHVNVSRLCCRALNPLRAKLLTELTNKGHLSKDEHFTVGAVCVYPARVSDCVSAFTKLGHEVNIASVATGFPAGQYGLESRLKEIEYAIANGASEIDIVINRALALAGDWKGIYEETLKMSEICHSNGAHLKTILATGELGSLDNVYKASMATMLGGADFIKTSTGKESVNATLVVGMVMCRAIWDFKYKYGRSIGFKPAGGLKTAKDALIWLEMIRMQLGNEWLTPDMFRFGASSLLNEIEKELFLEIFKRSPEHHELSI